MTQKYVTPKVLLDSFHCPFCNAYAHQIWGDVNIATKDEDIYEVEEFRGAMCSYCNEVSIWNDDTMVFPLSTIAPHPVEDMPDNVKAVFEEARLIAGLSPRAAVALLRLSLQLLLPHIGGKGKSIDSDIHALVEKGLSTTVRQALDSVRVVGNNAVHPGTIDITDSHETAQLLFSLINFVVTEMISHPKQLNAFYNSLPQSALDAIKKRDETP